MIQGIAHVALYTDKFEETIRFYRDAFGAEELQYFQMDRRGCWLKVGASVLEIFESAALPEAGCFKHVAFRCEHLEEAYRQALTAGAKSYVEPKDAGFQPNENGKLRIAFVKGINGEQIELCEGQTF